MTLPPPPLGGLPPPQQFNGLPPPPLSGGLTQQNQFNSSSAFTSSYGLPPPPSNQFSTNNSLPPPPMISGLPPPPSSGLPPPPMTGGLPPPPSSGLPPPPMTGGLPPPPSSGLPPPPMTGGLPPPPSSQYGTSSLPPPPSSGLPPSSVSHYGTSSTLPPPPSSGLPPSSVSHYGTSSTLPPPPSSGLPPPPMTGGLPPPPSSGLPPPPSSGLPPPPSSGLPPPPSSGLPPPPMTGGLPPPPSSGLPPPPSSGLPPPPMTGGLPPPPSSGLPPPPSIELPPPPSSGLPPPPSNQFGSNSGFVGGLPPPPSQFGSTVLPPPPSQFNSNTGFQQPSQFNSSAGLPPPAQSSINLPNSSLITSLPPPPSQFISPSPTGEVSQTTTKLPPTQTKASTKSRISIKEVSGLELLENPEQDYEKDPPENILLKTCAICHQLIKERYSFIYGQYYHRSCLKCSICETILTPPKCALVRDSLVCIDCAHRSKNDLACCYACNEIILQNEKTVEVEKLNRKYHINCFTCYECNCPLKPKGYSIIDNECVCKDCKNKVEKHLCHKCGNPIIGRFVNDRRHFWHLKCFTCHSCGRILKGSNFIIHHNYYFCPEHGINFLKICSYCKYDIQPTDPQRIRWFNKYYHKNCFLCRICGAELQPETAQRAHNRPHCQRCFDLRVQDNEITPDGHVPKNGNHHHDPAQSFAQRQRFKEQIGKGPFREPRYKPNPSAGYNSRFKSNYRNTRPQQIEEQNNFSINPDSDTESSSPQPNKSNRSPSAFNNSSDDSDYEEPKPKRTKKEPKSRRDSDSENYRSSSKYASSRYH